MRISDWSSDVCSSDLVQVDPTTDTVILRATLPNSQRLLVAGQFVGVIVERAQSQQALVIPQAAIVVDQAGPYVLVVNSDSKAEQRRIRPGSAQGADIVVAEGLTEGEQVIVDGPQKVRPGAAVAERKRRGQGKKGERS